MNISNVFAYDARDSEDIRLEKSAIFLVAGACTLAGIAWTAMYYVIFGWGLTTILPISFSILVGSSLFISHLSKNRYYAIYAQIICILYITTFIQWSIGSVFDSGIVFLWAFLAPICALMFLSIRQSAIWFSLYLINLLITVIFHDYFANNSLVVSDNIKLIFYTMNIGVASSVVFIFASYFVNRSIKEQEKTNRLLQTNLQQELALRQNEKLATLGKLSAGVAHELNNPASAVQRGSIHLRDSFVQLEKTSMQMMQLQLGASHFDVIEAQIQIIQQHAKQPLNLEPLMRSDREYEIETWLDERGVSNVWELAPMLVNSGYSCPDLAKLAEKFSPEEFSIVVTLLSHNYATYSVLEEIHQGSERIAGIVKALKSYSYLDQAPTQSIDIHEGLNDTLIMLGSKLKQGVQVRREYATDLPNIEAFGSELNQVWTNLIDNAIGAMDGQGEITIKTHRTETCVVVEIADTGSGIPEDIQAKIFDPFFTTKAPGEGTGLGLNISYNIIVQKHKGRISVDSKPGETCFEVKLPINYEDPQLDT